MATFIATTAGNAPKVRDAVAVRNTLERYKALSDVQIQLQEDVQSIERDGAWIQQPTGAYRLCCWGYDWPERSAVPTFTSLLRLARGASSSQSIKRVGSPGPKRSFPPRRLPRRAGTSTLRTPSSWTRRSKGGKGIRRYQLNSRPALAPCAQKESSRKGTAGRAGPTSGPVNWLGFMMTST